MQATYGPLVSSSFRCWQTRCHSKEGIKILHLISFKRVSFQSQNSLMIVQKILLRNFLFWILKRDLELKTLMTWHLIHSLMVSISILFPAKPLQLAKKSSLSLVRPRKSKWITFQSTFKKLKLECNSQAHWLHSLTQALRHSQNYQHLH
jgi:hypothetical protein